MRRRAGFFVAAAAAAAFALAACGGKSADGGTEAAANSKAEAAAADGQAVSGGDEQAEGKTESGEADIYENLDTSFNERMDGWISEDQLTAYLPVGGSEMAAVTADDIISTAAISPNRKHISLKLVFDGLLYLTDPQQKEKTVLSHNCTSSRVYAYDDGIIYKESRLTDANTLQYEEHCVRYTYADEKTVDLGVCSDALKADTSLALAVFSNGDLYVLAPDSSEPVCYKGAGSEDSDLSGVSADGSTVVWQEETDKRLEGMLYTVEAGGEPKQLGTIETKGFVYTQFSADSKLVLITSDRAGQLYLRDSAGQWKNVKLPGDIKNEIGDYMTDAGQFGKANADAVHYLYLRCGEKLCAVSMDGTVSVLADGVHDFDLVDGILYYGDTQKNIYSAALSGAELSEGTLLLSGPNTFAVSPDGNTLYSLYVHSDDADVRSLSAFSLKDGSGETMLSENIQADSHVYLSADDGGLYFMDDPFPVGEYGRYAGTLKRYHADTGETETIDEEVYTNSFDNGKEREILSEYAQGTDQTGKIVLIHGDPLYKKKAGVDGSKIYFDWYCYDGTGSVLLVEGLEY